MPHNYHMNFDSPLMREKREYYAKMGKVYYNVYMWFYKYSGLKYFFNTRFFKRGIEKDPGLPENLLNIPLIEREIGPNNGMMPHPQYAKRDPNYKPNSGGIKV